MEKSRSIFCKADNDDIDALKTRSIKNSKSLLKCQMYTLFSSFTLIL